LLRRLYELELHYGRHRQHKRAPVRDRDCPDDGLEGRRLVWARPLPAPAGWYALDLGWGAYQQGRHAAGARCLAKDWQPPRGGPLALLRAGECLLGQPAEALAIPMGSRGPNAPAKSILLCCGEAAAQQKCDIRSAWPDHD